jgi:hypothetical protein
MTCPTPLPNCRTRVEGIERGSLPENQEFVSTLFQASAIALREHRREKLGALRNPVLNTAITTSGDENEGGMTVWLVIAGVGAIAQLLSP